MTLASQPLEVISIKNPFTHWNGRLIDRSRCLDCGTGAVVADYVPGSRCKECSEAFDRARLFDRQKQYEKECAAKANHKCEIDDGTRCEECCDHQDTDDYCCLDCGKELLEDRMARAYDMAKDARKYGDC